MERLTIKLSDWIGLLTQVIGSLLLGVMVLVIGAEVIARYVFNSSFSWSEELGRIIFIWTIFLGTSLGIKRRVHMGINLLVDHVPPKLKQGLIITSFILSAVFFAIVAVKGFVVTTEMASQTTPALNVSVGWMYGAIPVSAFLSLLHIPSLVFQTRKGGMMHDLGPHL